MPRENVRALTPQNCSGRTMNRVTWVTQQAFGLSDGQECQHPFRLSEKWTVEQMQAVWDSCNHLCARFPCTRKRRPVFRPDIGYAEVVRALSASDYKQIKTANLLGVPFGVLRHRIKKYKITHERWPKNKPA